MLIYLPGQWEVELISNEPQRFWRICDRFTIWSLRGMTALESYRSLNEKKQCLFIYSIVTDTKMTTMSPASLRLCRFMWSTKHKGACDCYSSSHRGTEGGGFHSPDRMTSKNSHSDETFFIFNKKSHIFPYYWVSSFVLCFLHTMVFFCWHREDGH